MATHLLFCVNREFVEPRVFDAEYGKDSSCGPARPSATAALPGRTGRLTAECAGQHARATLLRGRRCPGAVPGGALGARVGRRSNDRRGMGGHRTTGLRCTFSLFGVP